MCLWWWNVFVYNIIILKHPLPINCVLHISLNTSDVPMKHFYITEPKYGGLYRTFYGIRNTKFLSIFLVIRVQKWKITNRLWCELSSLSKHAKLFDKLWISLSEAPFLNKIKLSDSCRWKYEYTQGEKQLVLCATCKIGISTLSLRINEHPYWIKLCYVLSTDTCAQTYSAKYHFK